MPTGKPIFFSGRADAGIPGQGNFPLRRKCSKLVLFTHCLVAYNREDATGPQQTGRVEIHEDCMTKQDHGADVAFIEALARLLKENDLTELEVKREYGEDDSLNVRVTKALPQAVAPIHMAAPMQMAHHAPAAPAAAAPAAAAASGDPADHPGAVTSPMVGTVYMAPEPGASPFVTVGATVTEGQTILIIEAMKTMNQIPAPRAGTIKRILVGDGSPVEFGAPLMIIE